MSPLYYTGIGSRETPDEILSLMTEIAVWLQRRGYRLRSGGAPGADTAFEIGAGSDADIYLPWRAFNGKVGLVITGNVEDEARAIAEAHHPAWGRCSPAARKLHTRNVPQVLGSHLRSPSAFVACWTKDGGPTGGTGLALRIAAAFGVPLFNLCHPDVALRLLMHVQPEGVFA